jgi:hypothetical protein
MSTVTIDTLDAVELAKILEYFPRTSRCTRRTQREQLALRRLQPYRLGDLRADVNRLVNRLNAARLTP